jgi:hypothetical protein
LQLFGKIWSAGSPALAGELFETTELLVLVAIECRALGIGPPMSVSSRPFVNASSGDARLVAIKPAIAAPLAVTSLDPVRRVSMPVASANS